MVRAGLWVWTPYGFALGLTDFGAALKY